MTDRDKRAGDPFHEVSDYRIPEVRYAEPGWLARSIAADKAGEQVGTKSEGRSETEQKSHPIRGEGEPVDTPCSLMGEAMARYKHDEITAGEAVTIILQQAKRLSDHPAPYKGGEVRGLLQEVIDHYEGARCQECAVVQNGSDLRNRILQALQSGREDV